MGLIVGEHSRKMTADSAFPETPWTKLLLARNDDTVAEQALEDLCQMYWYPLYAFIRRSGFPPHDAEDLTQEFFKQLLKRSELKGAGHVRGKLRSYLLGAAKHFLSNFRRDRTAAKRGGGVTPISIDAELAEGRYEHEPKDLMDPEKVFERRWALTVLESVLTDLQDEFESKGKGDQFSVLREFLAWNSGDISYAEAGGLLGMKEGNVKVTVHRMRQRYRELLQNQIARTVERPEDIDEELENLLIAFQ